MNATLSHALFWLIIALLLGWFISLISPILLPFIAGIAIAYLLDPLADRLEARGLSRTSATCVISASFFVMLILLLIGLVPLLVEQAAALIASIPRYVEHLRTLIEPYLRQWSTSLGDGADGSQLKELTGGLAGQIKGIVGDVLSGLLNSSLALFNFLTLIVITPVVSFYLLRDWDGIVAELDSLLPRRYAPVIREQCQRIDQTLSAFLRGQLNVMLALAAFYAIALSLCGLDYALVIALLAGALVIVPYVGTMLSGALAVGLAYVQFDEPERVGAVLGVFVAGQVLEGYVLTPRLVGRSVGLNPLWIIFGMMAGGAMLGFVGILIAVPVTAVAGVLLRFGAARYRESSMYKGT